jgi:kanamycin kinase/aminoglycoside 3'-phosphotransferase-2
VSDLQPPASLQARYPDHSWQPVAIGCSDALVWRLEGRPDLFVKAAGPEADRLAREGLDREVAALTWLAGHDLGAPEVVETGTTEDGWPYLVTLAVRGRSAAEPWPEEQRGPVVDALARFTARLHSLPADGCPIDPTARAAPDGTPVVCHGDFTLPNVIIDPGALEVSGIIDVGDLGLSDRYRDLAAMAWSLEGGLNPQYGPAYAERFLREATGDAVDAAKIARHDALRWA